MKKIKHFTLFLVILGSLFFLFGPEVIPENSQFQEFSNLTNKDIIVIFNSGGWGNTPLEKAEDFTPIIKGIQETLNNLGYNSVVIPYIRTKDSLLGKISGARDFFNSFQSSSEALSEKVEILTNNFPDKKIIITGLSSGGALVEETMEKIPVKAQNSVCAITAGTPFWSKTFGLNNALQLDNNRKDSLAVGEKKALIFTLLKAPFKWISLKINGQNLTLSQSFQAPGHNYHWSSPEVGPQIVTFLKNRLR